MTEQPTPASQAPLKPKASLDKDLRKIGQLEQATRSITLKLMTPAAALIFIVLSGVLAAAQFGGQGSIGILIAAALLGAYMALNIGANDVANNVGPAVGARALTMTGALVIAAIFECGGALIAGGDVVSTISKGIIDAKQVSDGKIFIWAMMAALLASAVWVNLATWLGAPVSTTHAVVGGVMGAGVAAAGFQAVNWPTMTAIAASWVISPLLGGVIAAIFLAFIKTFIIYQDDKIAQARKWVPLLIAIMAGCFTAYLCMKGLSKLWKIGLGTAVGIGAAVLVLSWAALRPLIARQAEGLENRNQSLRKLFHWPLIFSAALLSFAHGANDVANAIGPLAAIIHTLDAGSVATKVSVPLWVMLIGGAGISFGLFLYGPRLIRMVGEQITKMNPMRAYCVALSAAITVIVASALGLPVSSTHIAVGAVFGVGFFREYYTTHSKRRREYIKARARTSFDPDDGRAESDELIRRKLVRRSHFTVIVAAWVITVPASAVLAAAVFYLLRAFG
ncbi:MAG: inorganic phosphate transporter [Beijerinckiaceae bacterium]